MRTKTVKIFGWKPAVPVDQLARFADSVARLLVMWSPSTKPKSGVIALKQKDGSELIFKQT